VRARVQPTSTGVGLHGRSPVFTIMGHTRTKAACEDKRTLDRRDPLMQDMRMEFGECELVNITPYAGGSVWWAVTFGDGLGIAYSSRAFCEAASRNSRWIGPRLSECTTVSIEPAR